MRATRLSPASLREYRSDLTQFAHAIGRRRSLLTASADDAATWFGAHTRDDNDPSDRRPWSVRTAHRRRDTLLGFYRWLLRERLVRSNPVESVELPASTAERRSSSP